MCRTIETEKMLSLGQYMNNEYETVNSFARKENFTLTIQERIKFSIMIVESEMESNRIDARSTRDEIYMC